MKQKQLRQWLRDNDLWSLKMIIEMFIALVASVAFAMIDFSGPVGLSGPGGVFMLMTALFVLFCC